jgi:AcrR family transcriptional regulator
VRGISYPENNRINGATTVVRNTGTKAGTRKSRGSREKIVSVALREFSSKGLSGARVDRIARLAKTSKNMIYYHFGSKEGLYKEVMKIAYGSHRAAEREGGNDLSDPVKALSDLIIRSFDYFCRNEMFVRLVMSENMNRASHIKGFEDLKAENQMVIKTLEDILNAGEKTGVFRKGIRPIDLHLTISALGFHYISNRYTMSYLFDLDMSSKGAVAKRREEIVDVVLRWCEP